MAEIQSSPVGGGTTDAPGGCVSIDRVTVDGRTLTTDFSATGRVERFFAEDSFRFEYPRTIDDVPEEILVVPALAQVCPVAWACGAAVAVESVDPEFLVALHRVRESLKGLYPAFMEGGEIHCERTPAPAGCQPRATIGRPPEDASLQASSALLFSGGVDSLASYIRHRDEAPLLVSIQGWVLAEGERWERASQHISRFADRHGCETAFLRSNMLSVLDTVLLNAQYKPHIGGSWYSAVGHGLGLLGLCAPLCFERGIDTIHIAATHSDSFEEPWGSHPTIDNNVRWSGTAANHDGYDMTRQDKIESIAGFIREADPDLQIRTCTDESGRGGNCNACEKCYRTIVGLVIAGIDPTDHGYEVTAETFPDIRDGLESGRWILAADERFMWEDLQAAAPQTSPLAFPGADDFFAWLADADIDTLVSRSNPPLRDRLLRGVARRSPYAVYRSLYPVYRRVQRVLP